MDNNQEKGWKELLETYSTENTSNRETLDKEEKESIKEFLEYIKPQDEEAKAIGVPKFYFKKYINYNDLYFNLKTEAKSRFIQRKSYEIPPKKSLKELWQELKCSVSGPKDDTERINYADFKKCGEKFQPLFDDFFKATTFLKFDKDKYGRIEILAFFHYVVRKTNIEENKITLSLYDVYCEGFLTDKDLENFIKDEIRQFTFYEEITEEIKEYYLLVSQRKFFFFLDPKRTGKIYIKDIVTSPILTEFNEMKERNSEVNLNDGLGNWFSLSNFWRIYKEYIRLDKDKNGMLSKEELIKFGPGLTQIFIDRIFEEYQKYEGAIDFKQFIDFVLAMENMKNPASLQYIWRAIDVYHKNAVDTFVINMFFRQVVRKLINRNKGEYKIDDIKDEIWDMIKPKNQNYFTLQDVLNSCYSDTVLAILIDAKAFFLHDQKEMQVSFPLSLVY